MTQHHFAVFTGVQMTNGKVMKLPGGVKAARRRNSIARKIDPTAGYIYYYDMARRQWRGWGYCRNRGIPFDGATARAIEDAWAAAGV